MKFETYKARLKRQKNSLTSLRNKRAVVFAAFDIYKTNVYFGIENETEEQRAEIIAWYQECLDLNRDAITNPPSEIIKYMRK